jgi:two-component system response regulator YesN
MSLSYKIFIVDDEERVRNFLVSLFSKHGHNCETAKDGIEALEKIKKNPFDAVVIDIVMPYMDGITLTKELVKLYPDLPIMIMTGHVHEHSAKSAIAIGAREFIRKPFSIDEFIIRFDKMMHDHETLCKIKEKYNKKLFNAHRNSSEEIERLKGEIKTLGGKWSYFYDPND